MKEQHPFTAQPNNISYRRTLNCTVYHIISQHVSQSTFRKPLFARSKPYSILTPPQVLTSHNQMGNTGKPTGWYLPEFAHPYYKLEGKADITIASPKGGEAPLDPSSVEMFKEDPESKKFLSEKESLWKNTESLSKYVGKASEFDAVFFVGGRKSKHPFNIFQRH